MTKYLNSKDNSNRFKLNNIYKKLILYKFLFKNENYPNNLRFKIMLNIQDISKSFYESKIKNRCFHSTKTRSVYRISGLSKASFKDKLSNSQMNGFKKAS